MAATLSWAAVCGKQSARWLGMLKRVLVGFPTSCQPVTGWGQGPGCRARPGYPLSAPGSPFPPHCCPGQWRGRDVRAGWRYSDPRDPRDLPFGAGQAAVQRRVGFEPRPWRLACCGPETKGCPPARWAEASRVAEGGSQACRPPASSEGQPWTGGVGPFLGQLPIEKTVGSGEPRATRGGGSGAALACGGQRHSPALPQALDFWGAQPALRDLPGGCSHAEGLEEEARAPRG